MWWILNPQVSRMCTWAFRVCTDFLWHLDVLLGARSWGISLEVMLPSVSGSLICELRNPLGQQWADKGSYVLAGHQPSPRSPILAWGRDADCQKRERRRLPWREFLPGRGQTVSHHRPPWCEWGPGSSCAAFLRKHDVNKCSLGVQVSLCTVWSFLGQVFNVTSVSEHRCVCLGLGSWIYLNQA